MTLELLIAIHPKALIFVGVWQVSWLSTLLMPSRPSPPPLGEGPAVR